MVLRTRPAKLGIMALYHPAIVGKGRETFFRSPHAYFGEPEMLKLISLLSLLVVSAIAANQAAKAASVEKTSPPLNVEMETLDGQEVNLAEQVQGQGRAARERRQQVRQHAAVQAARSAAREVWQGRPGDRRRAVQSIRRAGAGHGRGDYRVLHEELRREVRHAGQGRREWRRCSPALQVP